MFNLLLSSSKSGKKMLPGLHWDSCVLWQSLKLFFCVCFSLWAVPLMSSLSVSLYLRALLCLSLWSVVSGAWSSDRPGGEGGGTQAGYRAPDLRREARHGTLPGGLGENRLPPGTPCVDQIRQTNACTLTHTQTLKL